MHYVYIVQAGKFAKIGYSNNVTARLENLQTANPVELVLLAKIEYTTEHAARRAEKSLHRECKQGRVRGEWFNIKTVRRQMRKSRVLYEQEASKPKEYTHQEYAELGLAYEASMRM